MKEEFWALPKQIAKADISDGAKLTYAVLFTRKNGENQAFPKRQYIAEQLGCSVFSVDKYIKQLKEAGLISTIQRGLKKSNLYNLTTPDLPNLTTLDSANLTTPTVRDTSKRISTNVDKADDKYPPQSYNEVINAFSETYKNLYNVPTPPSIPNHIVRPLLKRYFKLGYTPNQLSLLAKHYLVENKHSESKFKGSPSMTSFLQEKVFNRNLADYRNKK